MSNSNDIEYAEIVTVDNIERGITDNMLVSYNLSKSVIVFAIIDLIFGLLYAFLNNWFFIPIIFALFGYYGAKNYDKCLTFLYASNIFLINISRIIYSTYIYYNLSGNEKQNYIYDFILIMFCGILGLWISKIICKFYSSLNKLTNEEIDILKLVRYLENSKIIYW